MTIFLTVLHVFAAVALILFVLAQPDRGDGMAGAFGGMGGSVAFGVRTLDVMWKATIVLASVFMLTALGLTFMDKRRENYVPPPAPVSAPPPRAPTSPPAP